MRSVPTHGSDLQWARGKISCADLFSDAKDLRSAKSLKDMAKEWLIKPMTKERGLGLEEYLALLQIAADLKSGAAATWCRDDMRSNIDKLIGELPSEQWPADVCMAIHT